MRFVLLPVLFWLLRSSPIASLPSPITLPSSCFPPCLLLVSSLSPHSGPLRPSQRHTLTRSTCAESDFVRIQRPLSFVLTKGPFETHDVNLSHPPKRHVNLSLGPAELKRQFGAFGSHDVSLSLDVTPAFHIPRPAVVVRYDPLASILR